MGSLIASSFINNNDTVTTTTATTTAIYWLIGIVFMILAAVYSNLTEALPFHLNFIQTKSIYDDDTTKNNNVSPGLYFTLMTIFGIWWWTMGMCLFIVASSSSSEEPPSSSPSESNGFDAHSLAAIVIAALVPLIVIMIQIYRNSNPEGSRPPFLVVIMLAFALVSVTPIQQVWYEPIWKFGLPSWIAIMIGAYRIPTRATAKKCQKQQQVGSSSSSSNRKTK